VAPTAVPMRTGEPRSTVAAGPGTQQWRVTPFRVGETANSSPAPGWTDLTLYFAIENSGDHLDYYIATGRPASWLQGGRSSEYPLSQPAIAASSISTAEGYSYQASALYGSMPMIRGDDPYFYLSESIVAQWRDDYAPSYSLLPGIPPGFRFFGSISFLVASNTTEYQWVVPGIGEFDLSALAGDLVFPYPERPSYIKDIGDPLELGDGITITPVDFSRTLDGYATLAILFNNPTGLDFDPGDVQVHFFNSRGWAVPEPNYFACEPSLTGACPNPPPQAVGPGQQLRYTIPLVLPAELDDVYVQITYGEQLSSSGLFSTEAWALYELNREDALTSAIQQATASAQAEAQFERQLVDAAHDFVAAVLADRNDAARSYFSSDFSQPPGAPLQFRDPRWGNGELFSPLDTLDLKGCFLLIPFDAVAWHADADSWDVWISDTGRESHTFQALDGTQQTLAFYVRGSPGNFYLDSVFVSGCNAPPAAPEGWTSLGLVGEPISDISSSGTTIFVATNGSRHGIFRSDDVGRTWQAVNNGLFDFNILQVEVSPSSPVMVYAVDDGLWRSENGGDTWIMAEYGQTCGNPRSAAIASDDGQAVVWSNCATHSVSYDGGRTWQQFGVATGDRLVSSPSNREVIYEIHYGYYSQYFPTVERLVIGGDDLPLAGVGPGMGVNDLATSYSDASLVFVGTDNGIYRSRDGGGSWEPVNQSLPGQGSELRCTSVQTSPWDDQEVLAACNGLVFHSHDLGSSWEGVEAPSDVWLVHLVDGPRLLLAATEETGLWSSTIE